MKYSNLQSFSDFFFCQCSCHKTHFSFKFVGSGRGEILILIANTPTLIKTKLFYFSAFIKLRLPLVPLVLVVVGHLAINEAKKPLLSSNNHFCACYLTLCSFH